jgi:hypothetical protein
VIRSPSTELHSGARILSVVCVVTGQEVGFPSPLTELHREISNLSTPSELVAVLNAVDGDAARTFRNVAQHLDHLQVYVMRHRVDYATALLDGIENAIGDWVATIDVEADEPTVIHCLLESTLREHAEVALSVLNTSKRPLVDATLSRHFHRVFRALHGFNLASEAPSARLLSRAVVNRLLSHDFPLVAFETLTARGDYRRCVVPSARREAVCRTLGERAHGYVSERSSALVRCPYGWQIFCAA